MKRNKRKPSPLFKIRSKINSDFYYTSEDFPNKVIDNKVFIGVKKSPSDSTLNYVLKENFVKCKNEWENFNA